MPTIVAFLTQKGGPGKTTIGRGTAVALAQNAWDVMIADLDLAQASATEWNKQRLSLGHQPALSVQPFGSVAQAVSKSSGFDALIIDGAPHASTATTEAAKVADLVVIPTGLAQDDLRPAVVLAESLAKKHGIEARRIVFALNHVGDSERELEEARDYLAQTAYATLDGYLPQKTAYSRAHDLGLSVIETPYRGPRESAERLIQSVMMKIEELTN